MRDDNGRRKSKHPANKNQSQSKANIRQGLRRSRMEIAAYAMFGIATVLGIIVGCIYSSHRIPSIVLFGIMFLLIDVASCLYWAAKTEPLQADSNEARAATNGTIQSTTKVLFSSSSSSPRILEIGDSGAKFNWKGKNGSPVFVIGEDPLIIERLTDGRLAITTTIRDADGKVIAEIIQNEWSLRPSLLWDRNYNANAIEVRNEYGDIVLQARVLPDRIQLQGIWRTKTGRFFEMIKSTDPLRPGAVFVGDSTKAIKITPMFKYPSAAHLGEIIPN
jgi:hypothetical protein